MLPVLSFNGKTFTVVGAEPGSGGHYRVRRRQIDLIRPGPEEQLMGAVTVHGVLACATLQPDGRYWFNHATIAEIGEYGYGQRQEEIEKALRACSMVRVYA